MSEAAPQVHIWRANRGAAVRSAAAIIATLTGVGLLAFFGISTSDDGRPPAPLVHRLAVPVLMMVAGLLLVGLTFLISPREVRASSDGLVLRMWFGSQKRVPREHILGVRLYRRRRALEVVQRERASLYLSASNSFSPWTPGMGVALLALFGQTQEDRDYELSATRPDIAVRAARLAEFHARPPSAWRRAHAMVALVLAAAAGVGWGSISRWLINVEVQGEAELLLGALLVFGLGCFMLLGLVDAWRLFVSNRTVGLVAEEWGLVLRRRRGERRIPADGVAGVEVRRARAGRGPDIHVHLTTGGGLHLHEVAWSVQPGELAGVLLHRFGEWDPLSDTERRGWRAPGG